MTASAHGGMRRQPEPFVWWVTSVGGSGRRCRGSFFGREVVSTDCYRVACQQTRCFLPCSVSRAMHKAKHILTTSPREGASCLSSQRTAYDCEKVGGVNGIG